MIEPDADIELGTADAMAPFDEHREVAAYRVHLDHAGLLRMAERYGIAAADHQALSEKMEDWTLRRGGFDVAGLYYLTTNNPDGRFDWYEIGGRWDGWLNHQNVITADRLASGPKLKMHLPYFVLNPDGVWIQREQLYIVGKDVKTETIPEQDWLTKVRQQLQRWPEYQVVCVDAHC